MLKLNIGFLTSGEMASMVDLNGNRLSMNLSTAIIIGVLIFLVMIALVMVVMFYYQRNEASEILKEKTAALEHMVNHDLLTGLCNRNYMMARLQRELLKEDHMYTALYTIDLVNLKVINDAYGHDIGDRVLKHVAAILNEEFSKHQDSIGIYHTEFLVVDSTIHDIEGVRARAAYLIKRLSQMTIIEHMEIGIKVNIGVALAPEHSMEAKLLLKKADIAQIESARRGPNQYHVFKSTLYKDALKRITLEKQLRRAVVKNEFEVYYQPRISMTDMSVVGCEALIRWHHPDGKIVYPGNFIALAESVGFISDITKWVVSKVIQQVMEWEAEGHAIKVSFNISGKEFDDDFIQLLSQLIKVSNVDPALLEVEITETATLKDMEHGRILVGTLTRMGVSVALDDFGTGYSSMTYIKKLNANKLKIDRSFIEDIDDYQQKVVVDSMIELGQKLNYKVNVEGIETKEQLEILKDMQVDEVQGWYFSKAVPADKFIDYVIQNKESIEELAEIKVGS